MKQTESQLRIAEIEVHRSPLDEKILGLFRYESDGRGKRSPSLVILTEISSTLYVYEQLLDALNAAAEQTRQLMSAVETDPIARFEKFIQRINEQIALFLQTEPSQLTWNRVNIFLIEISDEHLCLSGIGRLSNLLLQKQEDGSYRSFDLFGSLEQPAEVDPQKPFGALICGELHPGDMLFAGSSNFERLRSELEIAQRLKTLPPVTAALEIQQAVERAEIPDDFAGVVIARVEVSQPAAAELKPTDPGPSEQSTSSVERMLAEEEVTQTMLGPAIPPLAQAIQKHLHWKTRIQERLATIQTGGVKALLKKWNNSRAALQDPIARASLRSMSAGHGSFITQKHKRIATLIVGVLLVATIGTLWYRHAQRSAAEQLAWNQAYDQATEQKNRAEADLVYGNEESSARLLKSAETILTSLDEKTSGRAQAKQSLAGSLQELKAKLKREQAVEHPAEVLTLPEGAGPITLLTWQNGSVYTFDKTSHAILAFDPESRITKRIDWPTDVGEPEIAASASDAILFVNGERKAFRLQPKTNALTPLPFNTVKSAHIASSVVYGARFYTLDPTSNMIWRYSLGSTIGSETTYLKQNSDALGNAVGMAIDASVYVAFSDGRLVRYLSGTQETWNAQEVDPPLQHISAIWTTADADRLVVVDPVGKRVIVFRKDGKLVAQITSKDFVEPRSIAGDEKNRKLYISDGERIFALELP